MAFYDYEWKPYVPVAERRRKAMREMEKRQKKGHAVSPVTVEGRTIAKTFWGKAWCENLEAYSDYANRLPRGRTYVRNGSVVDLQIKPGEINAYGPGQRNNKREKDDVFHPAHRILSEEYAGRDLFMVGVLKGAVLFLADLMRSITVPSGESFILQPGEFALARDADIEIAVRAEDDAVNSASGEIRFCNIVGELDTHAAVRGATRREAVERLEDFLRV